MKSRIPSLLKRLCAALGLALGVFLLTGCETGEAAFRQGDYAQAARVAADRLARRPDNEKAAEIFLHAYPQARAEWAGRARQALDNAGDPFRWERALSAYEVLQGLSTRAALTPFAGTSGIEIVYYHTEIESARINAGQGRIDFADALMEKGDLYSAREAFDHYSEAVRFAGQRDDLLQKIEDARRAGTLLVGVDPVVAQGHSLNPARVLSALVKELESHAPHRFVAFVPSSELGEVKAVQYLQLTVGEVSVVRSEAEIGQKAFVRVLDSSVQDTGESAVEVKATLFTREKIIEIACPAHLKVFEGMQGEAVLNRELPVLTAWGTQWDIVHGDRRALGGREVQLSEQADPAHAHLMQQLVEVLAAQARDVLAVYYKEG